MSSLPRDFMARVDMSSHLVTMIRSAREACVQAECLYIVVIG